MCGMQTLARVHCERVRVHRTSPHRVHRKTLSEQLANLWHCRCYVFTYTEPRPQPLSAPPTPMADTSFVFVGEILGFYLRL